MTTIKNILLKNNFNVEKISNKILNISIDGDVEVNRTNYLYKVIEISYKNFLIGINLDEPIYTNESEFTPFVVFEFDENDFIKNEKGFDENLNLMYENELWVGKNPTNFIVYNRNIYILWKQI